MEQPGGRAAAPAGLALVQDFVNTVDIELDRESLRSSQDLSRFCTSHGLRPLRFAAADLPRALAVREALRDVCGAHAGHADGRAASDRLATLFRDATIGLEFDADGGTTFRAAPSGGGMAGLVSHLAASIAGGLRDGTWLRLKACAADECRWVYYDASRSGTSRWCTMAICGSRAKMSTLRAQRRTR